MTLTEEIRKQIVEYSHANKHGDLLEYLKDKINKNEIQVKDLYEYARDYKFIKKEGQPYVINAAVINRIGMFLRSLENDDQKKFGVQFYKLAADRNSSWGNRNYAIYPLNGDVSCGIKKDTDIALVYARKAVELSKDIPTEEHEHKFLLCKSLRANKIYQEANIALIEFFEFKSKQVLQNLNPQTKSNVENEIKAVIELCNQIMKEFEAEFDDNNENILSSERCASDLQELVPFIECTVKSDVFNIIRQTSYFFKAKLHEKLQESSQAMLSYLEIKIITHPYYNQAIAARARLLKSQVESQATVASLSHLPLLNLNEDNQPLTAKKNESSLLTMSHNVFLPAQFDISWKSEAPWFFSVDEKGINTEFEKRLDQVKKLKTAKKVELSLIDESLKESLNKDQLMQRKKLLDEELKNLRELKLKLKQKYEEYLPANRKVYRRHVAESKFFDPTRTKKSAELSALSAKIIDHRFRTVDALPPPINLTGISSRLYITAERAFQEAVIALTGKEKPQLGIPTARTKPWSFDNGYSGSTGFGPDEQYQVGDTTIKSQHRTSPKRQRMGDSYLPEHGTYNNDIYLFLDKLCDGNIDKEKQLATYMIRYGNKHQSITLDELKNVYTEVSKDDVDHFNRVCFLILDKEQSQWHSATDKDYQLGMTVAQARCLIMIKAGFIGFKDAFKNDVLLGIYSNTGIIKNPKKVADSCKYIDDLYMVYLQNKNAQDHFRFLKKNVAKQPQPVCVLTREQAHQDMKDVYGGAGDTDDEGYSSDLSMK